MFQTLPPLSSFTQKVFTMDSCDEFVALILKQNGWKQMSRSSSLWNLRWTWKTSPKEYDNLKVGQYLNHFKGSEQITTKLGLSLLYKKSPVILDTGKSFMNFYPRSYNLSSQREQFIRDFNNTAILNLLKKIVVCLQLFYKQQYQEVIRLKFRLCLQNTEHFLNQLYKQNKIIEKGRKLQRRLKINGKIYLRLLFYLQNFFSLQRIYSFEPFQINQMSQYSRKQIPFNQQSFQYEICPSLQSLVLTLIYYEKCLKFVNCFYQDGFSNIWIVKSNHSSRGRNIQLINNLKNIQNLDNGMKLIQKYLQNIWILHQLTEVQKQNYGQLIKLVRKKFDIRFWVLVKSFTPLSVYIYDEAYLRISSQQYQLDFLNQKNSHLTNYSINWKDKSQPVEQQSFILYSRFIKYLKEEKNEDVCRITGKIHQIILQTLKLVDIKEDERCFQLFGFDIILDAKLNPWILQCNMSPACTPRGELKGTLKDMTEGLLSIMGFIDGNNKGWKSLTQDRKIYLKQKSNLRILRQLKIDNNSIFSSTVMKWNDLLLTGRKLQIKNYKTTESFHYFIEKVKYIQNFMRQKHKNCEKTQYFQQKKPKKVKSIRRKYQKNIKAYTLDTYLKVLKKDVPFEQKQIMQLRIMQWQLQDDIYFFVQNN